MRFTSALASSIVPTATAFGILDLEGGNGTILGAVLGANSLALAVGLIPAGLAADRFSRRPILIVAGLLSAISAVASSIVLRGSSPSTALLIAFAVPGGLGVALSGPAFVGIVPEVVPVHRLQSANAWFRLSLNVGRIAGSGLAGALVAIFNPAIALLAGGALSALSAAIVAPVRTNPVPRSPATSVVRELGLGWQEFRRRRWVVVIVAVSAVSNLGASAVFSVLGPIRSEEALDGAASWAAITAAFGIGSLVGAALVARLRPARPIAFGAVLLGAFALPIFALMTSAPMWVIVALAAVAGLSIEFFTVLWDTALQQEVPLESLSRVSAFDWLGSFATTPFAVALAGPLADAIGTVPALAVAGALSAVPPLALLSRDVRRRVA